MKTFVPAVLVPSQLAATWDYVGKGKNGRTLAAAPPEGSTYQYCATGSQSPIDLKKSFPSKSDTFTISTYEWPAATRTFSHETIKYQAAPTGGVAGAADGVVPASKFTSSYMESMKAAPGF